MFQCLGISGSLLKIIENFLTGRFQRILLNEKTSSCSLAFAGVQERPILGPLFFLIYMNDLNKDLSSTANLLQMNLLFPLNDIMLSTKHLNRDSTKISNLAYHLKTSINTEMSKKVMW